MLETPHDRRLLVVTGVAYLSDCTANSIGTKNHGLTGSASPTSTALLINLTRHEINNLRVLPTRTFQLRGKKLLSILRPLSHSTHLCHLWYWPDRSSGAMAQTLRLSVRVTQVRAVFSVRLLTKSRFMVFRRMCYALQSDG